ncbi:hypothetical protein [Micrococcus luteus]|uniref:hypothetical protein n=1 Tax=Micrococcus luteus TaxID=1270 RepID=UPI001E45E1DE|nr:hypothetical protein [Micrococcus luteus]MCD0174039.1 hypothetical protein [Micrococcus luteus]
MAIKTKLPIEFSCGHTETVDLARVPAGRRKAHAFGLGKNRVCTRCFRKKSGEDLELQNRQALLDADQFAQEHDLPDLTGSDKQVNWATRVRYQVLSDVLDSDETPEQQAQASRVVAAARELTRAGWWLDNTTDKDLTVGDFCELILTADESSNDVERIETENPF